MAATQHEVLSVLLNTLKSRELISQSAHDKAKNIVNSTLDFPEFFEYSVCCHEEENNNGRSKDQK